MSEEKEKWNRVQRVGKPAHEELLISVLKGYENDGYKVIKLNGKSPDGIVFKDGKAICIEILPKYYSKSKGEYCSTNTIKGKINVYENLGFDEIKIIGYKVPK